MQQQAGSKILIICISNVTINYNNEITVKKMTLLIKSPRISFEHFFINFIHIQLKSAKYIHSPCHCEIAMRKQILLEIHPFRETSSVCCYHPGQRMLPSILPKDVASGLVFQCKRKKWDLDMSSELSVMNESNLLYL